MTAPLEAKWGTRVTVTRVVGRRYQRYALKDVRGAESVAGGYEKASLFLLCSNKLLVYRSISQTAYVQKKSSLDVSSPVRLPSFR